MNLRLITIIFGWILIVMATGCSEPPHDARLMRVSQIVSDDPDSALQILDSIHSRQLSPSDRHYYDFLTIKAKDKNYIQHESDSLILDVMEYYSKNHSDPVYVESLYYGGRVYSDLGDYPTALRYYQQALDNLDQASEQNDLKSRLNSQIGMLLEKLRLYDQAISYFQDVLDQKTEENDSIGIVYTLQRLGGISSDFALQNVTDSVSNKYLNEADSLLTLSLRYSASLPEPFSAMSRVLLSGVKQRKGEIKRATELIRCSIDGVEPDSRNVALAYAAGIYLEAGVIDTAFMYAHELIDNEDKLNKKSGYRFLLSPEFRDYLHPDSLDKYYDEYNAVLEAYLDENQTTQALMQNSQFNYHLHERESLKAHKANERLWKAIVGFVFLVLALAVVILYLKYRNKSNIVRLQEALSTLETLKLNISRSESLNNDNTHNNEDSDNSPTDGETNFTPNTENKLRDRLRQELIELNEKSERQGVSTVILESDIYARIRNLLAVGKPIKEDMWLDLEKTVTFASPRFDTNLRILTQNKITNDEYRVALLVKCGFKPIDMRTLRSLTNGAINSRRSTLGTKIMDKKQSVTLIDNIIRLL